MDILEYLRSLRDANTTNDLRPRATSVERPPILGPAGVEPMPSAGGAGALGEDPFGYTPEGEEDPNGPFLGGRDRLRGARAALERRRAAMQDELEKRRYPGQGAVERFRGTTPGSPEFFARMKGEGMPPAQPPGGPEEPAGALPGPIARDIHDETGMPRPAAGMAPRRSVAAPPSPPDGGMVRTAAPDGAMMKTMPPGALADAGPAMGRDIHDESGTPTLMQGGALEAPAGRMPAARRQSLQDMFRARVDQIEKSTGDKLTDQQKSELQLDFFLRLMASGSKPGATLLHSVGEGGLATSALSRDMRERNKTDSRQRRAEDREDAFREIGLADKDEDNQRQQRHLDITDQHYKNMDARDRERLKVVTKQIEQGKWRVVNNAKTGTVTLYDQESGATKDTGIKYERTAEKDTRPPEIQLIEHLKRNPKDLELVERLRSKDKNDTDQIVDLAGKLANDVANPRSATDALDMAREIVGGAKREPGADQTARPKTDAEFKQLPKGTKFVNPKDGKVYTKN